MCAHVTSHCRNEVDKAELLHSISNDSEAVMKNVHVEEEH